jgi:putative SOS response-associated peptidase YedK
MCGRIVFPPLDDLGACYGIKPDNIEFEPTFNAAPTQELPVVIEGETGGYELQLMRWGLLPRWGKPGDNAPAPFNARAETVREKPMFRSLLKNRRCIVPVAGYYEWKKEGSAKQPYYLSVPGEPIIGLAGLYDELTDPDGETISSFTVITTPPNALSELIHNRMPAILSRRDQEEWMSKEVTDSAQVERLLVPFQEADMVAWPVAKAVGNVRNDSPDLIEPIGKPLRLSDLDD